MSDDGRGIAREHSEHGGHDGHGERDWFGNPLTPALGGPVRPVPCPMCGVDHGTRDDLEAHLAEAHAVSVRARRPSRCWASRSRAWFRGLRFLPLWFVLPVNLLVTLLLVVWAGGIGGFELFAEGDQLPVIKTWLVRLSLLPTVVILAWRTVDRRV